MWVFALRRVPDVLGFSYLYLLRGFKHDRKGVGILGHLGRSSMLCQGRSATHSSARLHPRALALPRHCDQAPRTWSVYLAVELPIERDIGKAHVVEEIDKLLTRVDPNAVLKP